MQRTYVPCMFLYIYDLVNFWIFNVRMYHAYFYELITLRDVRNVWCTEGKKNHDVEKLTAYSMEYLV